MGDDGDPPEGGGSEYDRMSLNSPRRELEVQKAQTETAREEAHERIRESSSGGAPWGKIAMVAVAGLVIVGGALALSAAMFTDEDWSLPDYVHEEWDGGSLVDPNAYIEDSGVDAGWDAGRRRHHPRHGPTEQDQGIQLDLGDDGSDDPLEGL